MTVDSEMRRGDLMPPLFIDVTDSDLPVDFSTASAVRVIGAQNGVKIIDRPATEIGLGWVRMDWQTADTDIPGTIIFEVEAMWPGAKPQTFRADNAVRVKPDLG